MGFVVKCLKTLNVFICGLSFLLFHADRWTERQTDMTKLIFHSLVNAP